MKRQSESGLFNWIDDQIFFQTKKYQRGAERREVKGRREKGRGVGNISDWNILVRESHIITLSLFPRNIKQIKQNAKKKKNPLRQLG